MASVSKSRRSKHPYRLHAFPLDIFEEPHSSLSPRAYLSLSSWSVFRLFVLVHCILHSPHVVSSSSGSASISSLDHTPTPTRLITLIAHRTSSTLGRILNRRVR